MVMAALALCVSACSQPGATLPRGNLSTYDSTPVVSNPTAITHNSFGY